MHKSVLLQNFFNNTLSFMHKSRQKVLFNAVNALMSGAKLTLMSLGRHMSGQSKEKHLIRKADRLLGNQHLHNEISTIFTQVNELIIPRSIRPIISIDWSNLCWQYKNSLLRASISVKGRSIVCYQEAHPKSAENNINITKQFIKTLKAVLPDGCNPIIVMDAAFGCACFSQITSLGWDYVARVRKNRGAFYNISQNTWGDVGDLYALAQTNPSFYGRVQLTKRNKLECNLVLFKKTPKGRKKKNKKGKLAKGTNTEKQSTSAKEPWVLVTSLPADELLAQKTVECYKKRMQIEEEFRDTKCQRFGFGLSASGTRAHKRLEVLLIIQYLASLLCWWLAAWATSQNKHADYHVNASKEPFTLSAIMLGRCVYKRIHRIPIRELNAAKAYLANLILNGNKINA